MNSRRILDEYPENVSRETFLTVETLACKHDRANNPYEPYSGVAALFDADTHLVEPDQVPREDWVVLSCYTLRFIEPEWMRNLHEENS